MTKAAQPRLLKGLQADYVPTVYRGSNTSGLRALGKNIIVMVDFCSEVSAGGVRLTDDRVERMTMQCTSGCIIQTGAEAFRWFEDGTPWVGHKPQIGERCYFEQYAGQIQRGIDGADYRVMDYRSVACVIDMDNPRVVEAMEAFREQFDEAMRPLKHVGRATIAHSLQPLALPAAGPIEAVPTNRKRRRAKVAGLAQKRRA